MELIHERISFIVNNHVAHVSLSRADKMNAIDVKMIEAISLVGERIRQDKSIRAVVLSADGDNFCSGIDKSNFTSLLEKRHIILDPEKTDYILADRSHGMCNVYQYVVWMWRELPMPVIVAINGITFGGGLQLMLGGDMRFASPQSRFSVMEMKWGLIPDMGGIQAMGALVRDDVIRMLSYTAKEFTAEQAKEWGFITDIVEDPLAHALEMAYEIAEQNPEAIRSVKKVIEASHNQTTAQGLLLEAQEQDKILGKANQVEAVVSRLQNRKANFVD